MRVLKNNLKPLGVAALLGVAFCLALIISNQIFLHLLGLSDPSWAPRLLLESSLDVWGVDGLQRKWVFSLIAPFAVLGSIFVLGFKVNHKFLFGHAHWATLWEARASGILAKEGLILGKRWGKYLRVSGFEHVFVFAPSGSGKTNALVTPNLFAWEGSCIVQDIKLSLFKITSGYREQVLKQKCFIWNPGSRHRQTHAYNPIDAISRDPFLRTDDLQKIANILIPDNPKQDPIWTAQPRQLFVAILLYLLDTPSRPATLGEMVRVIKNTPNFSKWITDTLEKRKDLDPLCYRNFLSFAQTEYRLQTNILQSFLSYFELFDNPLIDAATHHSDFDIRQLKKEKMTIYVGVSSDNLSRLAPLLTVFYQQVLDHALRELPIPEEEPHGILLLLDEFSALRRMEVLQKGIGLMREYRVRVMAIIQDLPQLYETYGHDGAKAFINNKYRVAFAPNDLDAARLISGWLGETTVESRSQNQKLWGGLFQDSQSLSYVKRPLMNPDEIMKLSKDKMIITLEGANPVLAFKNPWYGDSTFATREMDPISIPVLEPTLAPFDHEALSKAMKALDEKEVPHEKQSNKAKDSGIINEEKVD